MAQSVYPTAFLESFGDVAANYPRTDDICLLAVEGAGMAVVAQRGFARGEVVGAFTGPVLQNIAQHTLQINPQNHLLDPYFIGYLMHSCNPNVVLDMHERKAYCIRDIADGEPLCMDYASTEDKLFKQFPCCCQSPNCRHWITGRAELVNEEGHLHLLQQQHTNSGSAQHSGLQLVNGGSH